MVVTLRKAEIEF